MTLFILKAVLLLFTAAVEIPTIHTDRSAFSSLTTEGFEGTFTITEGATSDVATLTGFTVTEASHTPNLHRQIKGNTNNYVSKDNRALGFTWDGAEESSGDIGTLTFEFDNDINAFTTDILDFGTISAATYLRADAFTMDGTTVFEDIDAATGPDFNRGNLQFFGVTTQTPFRKLVFTSHPDSTTDLIVFDEVSFGVVPEPSSSILMSAAAGLVAVGVGCARFVAARQNY